MIAPRFLTSPDGTRLALYEQGRPDGPTVVAVHGYPDDHSVWDGVTDRLAHRCRVVRHDVRGAGASGRPTARAGYRMTRLLDDLLSVIDEVSPQAPVHLLGHDWGSIQCWAAVTDERLAPRIASFTSISGPSLAYAGEWLRHLRAHPRDGLRQLAHSFYVPVFLLPWLPERAIRAGVLDRVSHHHAERADQVDGLNLYRANIRGRHRPTPVPAGVRVQLVVPERDPYVTPAFAEGAARPWVEDLTVHRVTGGHWTISSRPAPIADLVAAFAGVDSR